MAAVLVVAAVVAVLLLRSPGGDYKVKARFQNAAQLVKGNLVQTYPAPLALFGDLEGKGIFPNSDCRPSGGEVAPTEGNPGCRVADPQVIGGKTQGVFPHIDETSYGAKK